jgi:hypothetical protein
VAPNARTSRGPTSSTSSATAPGPTGARGELELGDDDVIVEPASDED